jgi:hypothetical protein
VAERLGEMLGVVDAAIEDDHARARGKQRLGRASAHRPGPQHQRRAPAQTALGEGCPE